MAGRQVKIGERVTDHGEVFAAEHKSMSGRIRQQETKRTDSRIQGIKPWLWQVLKWAQRKDHRSLICNKTR